MTASQRAAEGSFFGRLFDFSFSSFITTSVVKVLYFLALLTAGIFCIGIIAAMGQVGGEYVALGIILAIVLFFLWAIWIRVALETIIILFRIAENTAISARVVSGEAPSSGYSAVPTPPPPPPVLPAPVPRGRVTVMDNGAPRPEHNFPFRQSFTVGSAAGSDIVLTDPAVFAQHLSIECGPGGWNVSDLSGSRPPTLVTPARQWVMPNGGSETIAVGEVRLGNSVLGLHALSNDPFASRS